MSERSEYAPGEFCWVDLSTTDVDGAKSFYGDLLGIEAEAAPGDPEETGGYGFFMKDGKMLGGIRPGPVGRGPLGLVQLRQGRGRRRHRGQGEGGRRQRPLRSRSTCRTSRTRRDAARSERGVLRHRQQQNRNPGAQLVNEPGAWTWNNLMTRDLEGAKDFYGKVFGWTAVHNEEAPPNVLMWQVEGQRWPEGMGGLMGITDDLPAEMPAHWQVYFIVENADEAIAKAESNGAEARLRADRRPDRADGDPGGPAGRGRLDPRVALPGAAVAQLFRGRSPRRGR